MTITLETIARLRAEAKLAREEAKGSRDYRLAAISNTIYAGPGDGLVRKYTEDLNKAIGALGLLDRLEAILRSEE